MGFFLLLIISMGLFLFDWVRFLISPIIPPKTSMDYILPSGGSVRVLANDLNQLGLLNHPLYFEILAYMRGYAKSLRAGEYRFEAGTTPGKLLKQIADGKVLWREITFVEGGTFNEMMEQLNNNPLIVHTLTGLPTIMLMMKLQIPYVHPEGLFFPDTYKYTAGMTDQKILRQAYDEMDKHLSKEWDNRSASAPYQNKYEALIAASIIEKEARIESDRLQISGVIKRRLAKNMLLQMDPTVIYAMGPHFMPPLRREDLKTDSPYNTYLYQGLPPTPICMPSNASIHAALHPAGGDVLYFVARGDGTHQFSATYSQHKEAIAKYER